MSLVRFVSDDGSEALAFDNERHRLPKGKVWTETPPNPYVVKSTYVYALEFPQLDSILTQYELDRQLNIEAAQERETREYQEAIIK